MRTEWVLAYVLEMRKARLCLRRTECFEHKHEVHIREALGLLSALQWVHELRLGPIDFELDSKKGVDNFASNK